MKIKGIILDIDGVIIGEKIGFNSPSPHPEVISALKKIKSKGIFVSLCTAKPHFAIKDIIESAGLDNLHITDGGGVIIDPIDNVILKLNIINSNSAIKVIDAYLKNNVYTEYYTVDDYFIEENQASEITKTHTHILQRKPRVVKSLAKSASQNKITKIMPIAKNEEDKKRLTELFKPFENEFVLSWGIHPVALPLQFGIITAKGISKKNAWEEIIKNKNISFNEVLGIGDSTSDWQFIQLCKYAAAMGNASKELKELVQSKGRKFSYIAPSVDENGIIEVFKHFKIV
ncbi:HAD-IIB family hydrolase [Candidatus Woesearchaeota archaeon]|nr:HAD-IIB family hydrolase [Candidatus Woesearchaeota archaeon]